MPAAASIATLSRHLERGDTSRHAHLQEPDLSVAKPKRTRPGWQQYEHHIGEAVVYEMREAAAQQNAAPAFSFRRRRHPLFPPAAPPLG